MRYFSMFSGIGGFEYGIEKAVRWSQEGFDEDQKGGDAVPVSGGSGVPGRRDSTDPCCAGGEQQRWECIGFSEIDKHASAVYKFHYPEHKNWGDAFKIKTEELPDFDLLVGGFPCQSFSIAGKREGFQDTRGTLFFEIARILRDKRPGHFLLENVAGLLSHDDGKTFATILRVLSDLGYFLQYEVLNSKNFGVPQNRERVFIIGRARELGFREVFPIGRNTAKDTGLEELSKSVVSPALTRRGAGEQHSGMILVKDKNEPKFLNEPQYGKLVPSDTCQNLTSTGKASANNKVIVPNELNQIGQVGEGKAAQGMRVYDTDGIATTVVGKAGGLGAKTGLYKVQAPNGKDIEVTEVPKEPCQLLEVRTEEGKQSRKDIREAEGRDSTLRSADHKKLVPNDNGLANCLTTGQEAVEKLTIIPESMENMHIRRLTPVECERLQAFDDGWTSQGLYEDGKVVPISDTQRYKMCGNAVTVNVIAAVISKMFFETSLQSTFIPPPKGMLEQFGF